MTKTDRFERIATIVRAADREVGEGARTRDVFEEISQDDLWKIWWLSTRPEGYEFNRGEGFEIGECRKATDSSKRVKKRFCSCRLSCGCDPGFHGDKCPGCGGIR